MNDTYHWRAAQYHLDELSDDQRGEFEHEMSESQAAREALAAVVELEEAALVCFQNEASGAKAAPWAQAKNEIVESRRRVVWMGLGAALSIVVCLAIVAPIVNFEPTSSMPVALDTGPNDQLDKLAFAWTEARVQFESPLDADWAEMTDSIELTEGAFFGPSLHSFAAEDIAQLEEEATEETTSQNDMAAETPSWMLAALSGLQAMTTDAGNLSDAVLEENE